MIQGQDMFKNDGLHIIGTIYGQRDPVDNVGGRLSTPPLTSIFNIVNSGA